jgi:tRNA(Arg) A34 adenosine deaminase TadA
MLQEQQKILLISLPRWIKSDETRYGTDQEKAMKVIELSRMNIFFGTGGVFGAAVFDREGYIVSQGVNMVVPERNSTLHAEIVAIMFAERAIRSHSLDGYTLATSAEPCAMCQAAIVWAGLDKVIYSATSADVEKIGFDEGDKKPIESLRDRGIQVIQACREKAVEVLDKYNGIIYNGKTK